MNLITAIRLLHHNPLLFRLLASRLLPMQINNKFKYNRHLTLACIKLYTNALSRSRNSVWQSVFFPTEIFYSMGISPFVFEIASSIMAKLKISDSMISHIECSGLTREICSFQKCVAGAINCKMLPVPKLIVTGSEVCDSTRKNGEIFSDKYSIPHFYIDVPYESSKESVDYLKKQLLELISWLEKNTGRKFSEDKLLKVIEYSNELRRNMIRIMDLRRKFPGIMGSKPLFGLFNFNLLYGSPEGIRISEILYRELEDRTWIYTPPEGLIKILWLHFAPFYKENFTQILEDNPRVSVVFEEMNNVYWEELSPDDPLGSIAKKILSSHFRGFAQHRVKKVMDLRDLYDADGVIHFSHISCRKCNAGVRLIKEALDKKRIPLLDLSGDCIDGRNYSEGQMKTRLEAFIELFD